MYYLKRKRHHPSDKVFLYRVFQKDLLQYHSEFGARTEPCLSSRGNGRNVKSDLWKQIELLDKFNKHTTLPEYQPIVAHLPRQFQSQYFRSCSVAEVPGCLAPSASLSKSRIYNCPSTPHHSHPLNARHKIIIPRYWMF
jgi:hypothetical protein